LPDYHGRSIQEALAFIAGEERWFRIDDGHRFPTDALKIDCCVLAFGKEPARRWGRYKQRAALEETTWEEFKDWMLDSIKDKGSRLWDAAKDYKAAR
jgi:hypothetical protein